MGQSKCLKMFLWIRMITISSTRKHLCILLGSLNFLPTKLNTSLGDTKQLFNTPLANRDFGDRHLNPIKIQLLIHHLYRKLGSTSEYQRTKDSFIIN